MGSLLWRKGNWCVVVCVVCVLSLIVCDVKANNNNNNNNNSKKVEEGVVYINGKSPIATTDDNFVCATMDWWPPDNCDFGTCSWGMASSLNLDLKNVVLLNAVKAFSPLKIRAGGTLQDRLIYQTQEETSQPCNQFTRNTSQIYNYTEGCLSLARWDQLNHFFKQSGAMVYFGINALYGKQLKDTGIGRGPGNTTLVATGPWNSTNAASFIRYTVSKGFNNVHGWELGNELGGSPIGVAVAPDPYASDTIAFHELIQDIYKGVATKPLILAPGGIYESNWFRRYIPKAKGSLDVITHHIYNLGAGGAENLEERILNASVLDSGADVFKNLKNDLKKSGSSTVAWVGEAGGVFMSGRDGISNAYLFSFWYLDQLGTASVYDTKTYCRQTLIGGNYGLLDTNTFVPNPDYYSALLWHRLMGKRVLLTKYGGNRTIRAYTHCAKQSGGTTTLLINIDGDNVVHAKLEFSGTLDKVPGAATMREEYHLTPLDGNITSRTVLLNGKALSVGPSGAIPALEPVTVTSSEAIKVDPYSIVFVHMPNVAIKACQ